MNNLLTSALSIIPKSSFTVENFVSSTINNLKVRVPVYSSPRTAFGIVESVKNSAYQQLGLEFGKNYIAVWTNEDLKGVEQQVVADKLTYNGKTFNVVRESDNWKVYNGWNAAICVEDKS